MKSISKKLTTLQLVCAVLVVAVLYTLMNRQLSQRMTENFMAHGDVVAVRDGYHPFVTAYGYDAYYLNVLAGTRRSMAASDDPKFAHFRREWPSPDPRVPIVPPPQPVERARVGTA